MEQGLAAPPFEHGQRGRLRVRLRAVSLGRRSRAATTATDGHKDDFILRQGAKESSNHVVPKWNEGEKFNQFFETLLTMIGFDIYLLIF